MLVLTRKLGESVLLIQEGGETVEVIVNKLGGERVRLAFKAPDTVKVVRGELNRPADYNLKTGRLTVSDISPLTVSQCGKCMKVYPNIGDGKSFACCGITQQVQNIPKQM